MENQISGRLQELRKQNGYSQEQLADALNVSRQAVSKWECGTAAPDTENLIALAKLYNCSIDAIVFEGNAPVPSEKKREEPNCQTQGADRQREDNQCADKNAQRIVGAVTAITVFTCVIVYVLCGALLDWWHPTWIIFFAIPIVPSLIDSILKRKWEIFCFPVLIVAVYLLLGCGWGLWHPWWILFLLIPAYYTVSGAIHKSDDD